MIFLLISLSLAADFFAMPAFSYFAAADTLPLSLFATPLSSPYATLRCAIQWPDVFAFSPLLHLRCFSLRHAALRYFAAAFFFLIDFDAGLRFFADYDCRCHFSFYAARCLPLCLPLFLPCRNVDMLFCCRRLFSCLITLLLTCRDITLILMLDADCFFIATPDVDYICLIDTMLLLPAMRHIAVFGECVYELLRFAIAPFFAATYAIASGAMPDYAIRLISFD